MKKPIIRNTLLIIVAAIVLVPLTCYSIAPTQPSGNQPAAKSQAKASNNIVIKKENGLIFYYPQFNSMAFACETMPQPTDENVLMCCEAAFTGKLLTKFDHTNIAGHHVSSGKFHKGYTCRANSGYFEWNKTTGKWKFAKGTYTKASSDGVYAAFEQALVIYNGTKNTKQPQKTTSKNEYRVLAELNGKLCIIDSDGTTAYSAFIANLLKAGVKHALYLDMGPGWNYSYYRDNDNQVQYIHTQKLRFTTNWIVFKK